MQISQQHKHICLNHQKKNPESSQKMQTHLNNFIRKTNPPQPHEKCKATLAPMTSATATT